MNYLFLLLLLVATTALAQESENEQHHDPFEVTEIATDLLSDTSLIQMLSEVDAKLEHGILMVAGGNFQSSELAVQLKDGKWYSFSVPYDQESIKISRASLDTIEGYELIIRGEKKIYGNGGGTTDYGIIIVKPDTSLIKLFDFWNAGAEENFGHESPGYFDYAGQEVEIEYHQIVISQCQTRPDKLYHRKFLKEKCPNDVPPGIYRIKDGKFRLVPKTVIKRNTRH